MDKVGREPIIEGTIHRTAVKETLQIPRRASKWSVFSKSPQADLSQPEFQFLDPWKFVIQIAHQILAVVGE
jgi:hypothetical protein